MAVVKTWAGPGQALGWPGSNTGLEFWLAPIEPWAGDANHLGPAMAPAGLGQAWPAIAGFDFLFATFR